MESLPRECRQIIYRYAALSDRKAWFNLRETSYSVWELLDGCPFFIRFACVDPIEVEQDVIPQNLEGRMRSVLDWVEKVELCSGRCNRKSTINNDIRIAENYFRNVRTMKIRDVCRNHPACSNHPGDGAHKLDVSKKYPIFQNLVYLDVRESLYIDVAGISSRVLKTLKFTGRKESISTY
jgi:hypothetical protein